MGNAESRANKLKIENDLYKESVIKEKLKNINPALLNQFNTGAEATRKSLEQEYQKNLKDQQTKNQQTLENLEIDQTRRFKNLNRVTDGVAGVLEAPYNSMFALASTAENGVAKTVGGFTDVLSSPLTLIVVGTAIYFILK